MKIWIFAVMITIVYSIIVYIINVNIGLYAGIIALVILIYVLRWITTEENRMSKKEIEEFGKKTIVYQSLK